jgi:hypothetical protein
MGNQKVTNILLVAILIILLTLLFKNTIKNYFRYFEVSRNADIANVPTFVAPCYHDIDSESCNDVIPIIQEKETRWKELINLKGELSCSDFPNGWDATEFNWYINKDAEMFRCFNMKYEAGKKYSRSFLGGECHCNYDPYGLDTDHDCISCEK